MEIIVKVASRMVLESVFAANYISKTKASSQCQERCSSDSIAKSSHYLPYVNPAKGTQCSNCYISHDRGIAGS